MERDSGFLSRNEYRGLENTLIADEQNVQYLGGINQLVQQMEAVISTQNIPQIISAINSLDKFINPEIKINVDTFALPNLQNFIPQVFTSGNKEIIAAVSHLLARISYVTDGFISLISIDTLLKMIQALNVFNDPVLVTLIGNIAADLPDIDSSVRKDDFILAHGFGFMTTQILLREITISDLIALNLVVTHIHNTEQTENLLTALLRSFGSNLTFNEYAIRIITLIIYNGTVTSEYYSQPGLYEPIKKFLIEGPSPSIIEASLECTSSFACKSFILMPDSPQGLSLPVNEILQPIISYYQSQDKTISTAAIQCLCQIINSTRTMPLVIIQNCGQIISSLISKFEESTFSEQIRLLSCIAMILIRGSKEVVGYLEIFKILDFMIQNAMDVEDYQMEIIALRVTWNMRSTYCSIGKSAEFKEWWESSNANEFCEMLMMNCTNDSEIDFFVNDLLREVPIEEEVRSTIRNVDEQLGLTGTNGANLPKIVFHL